MKPGKAAGPDGISPRLRKTCLARLCGILAHIFNLILPNHYDYRPVTLNLHIRRTLEAHVLSYIKASVSTYVDPLKFSHQPKISLARICMLQRARAHLDTCGASARSTFFPCAVITIQPRLETISKMQVDPSLVHGLSVLHTIVPAEWCHKEPCWPRSCLPSTQSTSSTTLTVAFSRTILATWQWTV